MAKSEKPGKKKPGKKLERARARADEDLQLAREKAERKISKVQTALRAGEQKIRERLQKKTAKIEGKRAGKKPNKRVSAPADHVARPAERDHLRGRSSRD